MKQKIQVIIVLNDGQQVEIFLYVGELVALNTKYRISAGRIGELKSL